MRIALLYPPPWKIPPLGQPPAPGPDGPPAGHRPSDLDPDFYQIPYGLLSLAAQARRAGHQVKVLNLSAFPWPEVERSLRRLEADLYGLSCFTANRRGVALTARTLRRHHRDAHIVVGGPHASALPRELLEHERAIDTVVIGEGENTLEELLARLADGRGATGLAGAAWREAEHVTVGPPRDRIADLDALASVHEVFDTHLLLTARGCPGRCTFCAKGASWGHLYRTQSPGAVLDSIDQALQRLPVRMMVIKDDTFTAKRERGLAICEGIRKRGLRFLWSCDTRADAIDAELLRAMRLAGCQRLSFGVESGSPTILRNIQKRISPQQILEATGLAKRVGLQVRYYLMLGNRGETAETFRESLALVQQAQPHQALFACLSVYPGTQDFDDLEQAGALDREEYFRDDFQELKTPYDASAEDTQLMSAWFEQNAGLRQLHRDGIEHCRAVLAELGDHHAAHLDLAGAYLREQQLDQAEAHTRRALDLGLPVPGLAHNLLACIAAERGDGRGAEEHLAAARCDPQHAVLVHNAERLRVWRRRGGGAASPPPKLRTQPDFELLERTVQPMLPGPLPEDLDSWS